MNSKSLENLAFKEIKQTVSKNVRTSRNAAGWERKDKKLIQRNDDLNDEAPEWTQEALARKTGLSRATIAKIETNNASDISLSTLFKLAKVFGIPTFVLLMGPRDWERIEGLTMLKDSQLIQELVNLVKQRKSEELGLPASEATTRLQRLSKSESEDDKELAAREIHQVVAALFHPKLVKEADDPSGRAAGPEDDKTAQAIGIPRRIASAIGTCMLPAIPFLNGVIAGLLSIPFEKLITKNKKG